jgi:hypothetical protein
MVLGCSPCSSLLYCLMFCRTLALYLHVFCGLQRAHVSITRNVRQADEYPDFLSRCFNEAPAGRSLSLACPSNASD